MTRANTHGRIVNFMWVLAELGIYVEYTRMESYLDTVENLNLITNWN